MAALALLALIGALVLGWTPLIPASLLLLGGLYGTQLAIDDAPLDGVAALVRCGAPRDGGARVLVTRGARDDEVRAGDGLRRAAFVSALALCAVVSAELLLVLVEGLRAGGLAVDLLGAVAAGAVLLLVVVIARRAGPRGNTTP